jgi:hypothetical protein
LKRVADRDLADFLGGGFDAADPHLNAAEWSGIGRGGLAFGGVVGDAVGIKYSVIVGVDCGLIYAVVAFVSESVAIVVNPV